MYSGILSVQYPTTGTPAVSRYSIVSDRSRIGFVPEHTTITAFLASDSRSVEISIVFSAPICAPPIPLPQATGSPTMAAVCTAAAIVMTPSCFLASRIGISLADALKIDPRFCSRYMTSSSVSPTWICPFKIAVNAGTAPFSLTVFLMRNANSEIPG